MTLRIEHRIGINAPAETIWEIVSDIPSWAAWNPLYPQAAGVIRIGETLRLTQALPGQKPEAITPRVLDWVPYEQLHWVNSAGGGLVKSIRYIEIEKLDEDSCIFSNGELFSGLIGEFVAKRMRHPLRGGFAAMSEALKVKAEALYATQPQREKVMVELPKAITPIEPMAAKPVGRHKALYRTGAR